LTSLPNQGILDLYSADTRFEYKIMSQLPLFSSPLLWSVSDLTRYLRDILESDEALQNLWVQGEISNLSRPASGHLYFTLKDSGSALRCVMWRNAVARLQFAPRDGQAVEAHGNLSIYEAGGVYQLYADLIRPAGEGALYMEFLRLKARLEEEGLFDPERKRPIPPRPRCIGIITSPSGAALQDMLNTLRRRYPLVNVVLAPSPVQGNEAPPALIAALEALNRIVHPDVILLARGGGSIEDLWAFNDEGLAHAIAASEAPVITGVGHETDFTIADFVSDLRAPTPTAAAELATPQRADLQAELNEKIFRLERAVQSSLTSQQSSVDILHHQLNLSSPARQIRSDRQQLDEVTRRAVYSLDHQLQMQRAHISGMTKQLISLNPVSILQRGFAIVTQADGQVVRSTSQVRKMEQLDVRVKDGQFQVQVLSEKGLS
jgi:exodeoxyribonuclease VII large subunit